MRIRSSFPVRSVALLFCLAACGGSGGGRDQSRDEVGGSASGLVQGRVRTEDGSQLKKVTVQAGDRRVVTDEHGHFEVEVKAGDAQRIAVDSKDFAGGEVVLTLAQGGKASVELGVMRVRTFEIDAAEKGGRFEDSDGFVIDLPGKALRDADDVILKGPAEIRYATVRDPALMRVPPELRGVDDSGREVRLSSKGFVEVRFYKDADRVAFKGKATIEVPLPPRSAVQAGDRIGLYHYDTQIRRFKQEGEAVVNDEGKWVASVDKFSWWTAAEVIEDTACVRAELRTPEDEPAEGAHVTAVGLNDLWLSSASVGADGQVCVEAPRGSQVQLSAFWDGDATASDWSSDVLLGEDAASCGGDACEDLGAQQLEPTEGRGADVTPGEDGDGGQQQDAGDSMTSAFARVMASGSAQNPGETVVFPFEAQGLERLAYTISSTANTVADVRLLDPSGKQLNVGAISVSSGGSAFEDAFLLPEVSGRYTLEVAPRNEGTGSFDLDLFGVPDDVEGEVAIDGSEIALDIDAVGQNAGLSFSAEGGERLAYTAASALDAVADIRLIGPNGSALNLGSSALSAGNEVFEDQFVLPEVAGQYRFEINPRNQGTGSLRFRLFSVPDDLVIDGRVDGEPVLFELMSVAQNGVYRFEAEQGTRLAYTVRSTVDTPTDIQLIDPNGQAASNGGGSLVSANSAAFEDLFELADASGTYELRINPRNQGTGTILLNLFGVPEDVSPEPQRLVDYVNAPTRELVTTTKGQNAYVDILVEEPGETVTYAINNGTGGPMDAEVVRLDPGNIQTRITGSTTVISTNTRHLATPFPLPTAGTYRLLLSPRGEAVGAMAAQIYRVPPPAVASLSNDVPNQSLTLGVPGQLARFTVVLEQNQRLDYQVARGGNSVADVKLLHPSGSETRGGTVSSNALSVTGFVAPLSGDYIIEVDPREEAVDTYRVSVTITNPE